MNNFWDEKYNKKEYLYGTAPNNFIKQELSQLKPGKILFPAEGEGRNAVWAAKQVWEVHAFDASQIGQQKAIKLASENNVTIYYNINTYQNADYNNDSFDIIALCYTHMPSEIRQQIHHKFINWLKPGGILFMEVFSKEQLQYNSGGPKSEDMLFSEEILTNDFSQAKIQYIHAGITELNEGFGHQGKGAVIRAQIQKINQLK